jgi:hypothetical protein
VANLARADDALSPQTDDLGTYCSWRKRLT